MTRYQGYDIDYIGNIGNLRQGVTILKQPIRDPKTGKIPLSHHLSNCPSGDLKYKMQTEDLSKGDRKRHIS